MKFDIKKLEKYYNRPSFNFLAYQGLVFSLLVITSLVAPLIVYTIFDFNDFIRSNILETAVAALLVYTTILLPYVILYSWLSYSFYVGTKRQKVLFQPTHLIITTILISIAPILERISCVNAHSDDPIAFVAFFTIPFIPPTAILFTLLPYLVICYREKKHNLTIENPPFIKNKYLLYATLFGTALYILVNIVVLYITVTYFFEIKFFT